MMQRLRNDPAAAQGNQFAAAVTYLSSVWGIFSFGLSVVPLIMMILDTQSNLVLQPVASPRVAGPISLLCTAIISFYMFTLRDDLYRYSLTLPFRGGGSRPLSVWALIFFVIAIFLSFILAFGVTSREQIISPSGVFVPGTLAYGSFEHLLVKMAMTGALVFLFVFLSLSAGLMAAYTYGKTLALSSEEMPIYADEERLKEKVLSSVTEQLGLREPPVVSEMRRRGDGGIGLTLHYLGEPIELDNRQFREDRTWEVRADHLGQLIEVDEKDVRQVQVEAFQIEPVLTAVRATLGIPERMRVVSMRRGDNGEVMLVLEHDSRTWVVTADRWSRVISLEARP